jgi:ribosomal protein S18 acetylase RimI-like enzyme
MEPIHEPDDEYLLDNPIWHSLITNHRSLSVGGELAKRYPVNVADFAGFPNDAKPNWTELAKLMSVGESIFVPNVPLPEASGFVSQFASDTAFQQYVYRATTIHSPPDHDIRELNAADVPDMMHLVGMTRPGPFLTGTIEMGRYIGIRVDGRLIAMAGERLHPGRYCEISGVCTDPVFAKRGYATQLVNYLIARILERGERPFLHVASDNTQAIRLYKKMGFVWRKSLPVQIAQFVGVDNSMAKGTDD